MKEDLQQNLKIQNIEMTILQIGKDFSGLKNEVDQVRKDNLADHKEIIEKIDKFIEQADKRYAPMIAWKAIWWIITGVCGAVLAVIMKTILVG